VKPARLESLHRSLCPITPRPELKARLLEKVRSEKVVSHRGTAAKSVAGLQRITGMIAAGIIASFWWARFTNIRNRAVDHTAVVNYCAIVDRDLPLYGAGAMPQAKAISLNDSARGHIFVANLRRRPRKNLRGVDDRAQLRPALRRRTQHRRDDKAVCTSNQLPAQRP